MIEKANSEHNVRLNDMFPIIEEKLKSGGDVIFKPRGVSMLPLIRQGLDSVRVSPVKAEPQVGDVIFYRRPDGRFVLHRIIGRDSLGYILCGDNQWIKEHGVKLQWIIGVMSAVERDGKAVDVSHPAYLRYVKRLPLRRLKLKLRNIAGKIKRKIIKR